MDTDLRTRRSLFGKDPPSPLGPSQSRVIVCCAQDRGRAVGSLAVGLLELLHRGLVLALGENRYELVGLTRTEPVAAPFELDVRDDARVRGAVRDVIEKGGTAAAISSSRAASAFLPNAS